MVDSNWDNGGVAPKQGLPVWGKVALGCGAAVLCFVLAVGSLVAYGFHKAGSAFDQAWAELYRGAEGLRTVAGTKALYHAHPGLAQSYATEAEFLEAAAAWRPKLGPVPAQRPDFRALFDHRDGDGFKINTHLAHGRKWTEVQLRMTTGATLVVETEGEELTDIRVD